MKHLFVIIFTFISIFSYSQTRLKFNQVCWQDRGKVTCQSQENEFELNDTLVIWVNRGAGFKVEEIMKADEKNILYHCLGGFWEQVSFGFQRNELTMVRSNDTKHITTFKNCH